MTVIARRKEQARFCCAIQMGLRPLGNDLHALSVRIADIQNAIFDVRVLPDPNLNRLAPVWRGPAAPAAPKFATRANRRKVHKIDSVHLRQERSLYVDTPVGFESMRDLPVIYFADGGSSSFASIAEALRQEAKAAPVIIVGIQSARSTTTPHCAPRCDPRSQEYLLNIPDATPDESRFDAHARFVNEEVIPYIEERYPVARTRDRRATAGFSSGAAWAVSMAARYPKRFANVIGLSLGWKPAAEEASKLIGAKVFLGAGKLEARFFDRTRLASDLASASGAEVRLLTPNAGHSMDMWEILFADALPWLFAAERQK